MKLRTVASLAALPILFGVASTLSDMTFKVMGNGSGYNGEPPPYPEPRGPYYRLDASYECSPQDPAPKYPGYRELIRFSHFGPAGCTNPETCTEAWYWREDACQKTRALVKIDGAAESPEYLVQNPAEMDDELDPKHPIYGHKLMVFEGRYYAVSKYPPYPGDAWQPRHEAWCVGGSYNGYPQYDVAVWDYDPSVESKSPLMDIFLLQENANPEDDNHYTLSWSRGNRVSRTQKGGITVYTSPSTKLEIDRENEVGKLELQIAGKKETIEVRCPGGKPHVD